MASFEKRSDKWSVRFRETVNGKEVNRRLSGFKTKEEAAEAYKKHLDSYVHHTDPTLEEPRTFEELLLLFLERSRSRQKESTYYTQLSKINTRIRPYFGPMQLSAITPAVILRWQNTLLSFSFKYRSALNALVNSVFLFGNRYYDIPNPMAKVEPIRNLEPQKETIVWAPNEFYRFLSVIDEPTYLLLFRFLYISGCRKGEALALSPQDVDVAGGAVRINKNLTRKIRGKPYAITTPKNKSSNRTIEMPPDFLSDLVKLVKSESDPFIFGGSSPIPENTLTRRYNSWIKEAGVRKIRIHDLRHSCASYLISQGVSVVAVSRRLGHSSVTQTLNTYSHMMKTDSEKILELFSNF